MLGRLHLALRANRTLLRTHLLVRTSPLAPKAVRLALGATGIQGTIKSEAPEPPCELYSRPLLLKVLAMCMAPGAAEETMEPP